MSTTKTMTASSSAIPVILYGVGADNKPLAGLFPASVCDRAMQAATQLKLNVVKVTTSAIADVAKRLPAGRINAAGKGLVPAIRQPVYDQILKAVKAPTDNAATEPTFSGPVLDFNKIPLNEARRGGNPVGSDGLPKNWKDIGPNHLVLVQESASDGWWECIVVARHDDMLTVRWKAYPKYKPFQVHADAVALLNANPSFKA